MAKGVRVFTRILQGSGKYDFTLGLINQTMTLYNKLISKKNLLLAWKRIRTGQNVAYKRFFRQVYDGLDIGIDYQIAALHASLASGTYTPQSAKRVLLAKPSGLQRPITFLDPKDQIVLQAIANMAAVRMEPTRRHAIASGVCSNRLMAPPGSIHYFKPWKDSYGLFRNRVEAKINSGMNYAADFDLASFYDTISHTRLIEIVFGKHNSVAELASNCLQTWTPRRIKHGLSQGPIASDYLAECYLSLIDSELTRRGISYLRYVDDILIFGRSATRVQSGVLVLESICRENGLIPQAGKFKPGRKVKHASELIKTVSGYAYTSPSSGTLLSKQKTASIYMAAFPKENRIILRPTLAKRALFRGAPTARILAQVLADIESNPAFIEAYSIYLQRFGNRTDIAQFAEGIIQKKSPYLFVQGEYWNILTSSSNIIRPSMVDLAKKAILIPDGLPVTLRIALYSVLLKDASRKSSQVLVKVLRRERTDWARAWTISHFRRILGFPEAKRFASTQLKRETLAACSAAKLYAESVVFPPTFPLPDRRHLSRTAKASLQRLGLVAKSTTRPPEAISSILHANFNSLHWHGWRKLLGTNYEQARVCLQLAMSEYDGNPSAWMGNLDSFNDIAVRCVMDLARTRLMPPNLPPATHRGKLTNYGFFLSRHKWFEVTHPSTCTVFFKFHSRRNHLTSSHAFDSLTNAPSKPLKYPERKPFVKSLRIGYNGLQRIAQSLMP